jgi:hypothetical protein
MIQPSSGINPQQARLRRAWNGEALKEKLDVNIVYYEYRPFVLGNIEILLLHRARPPF